MSTYSHLDARLDQFDGENLDLLVRISEDWPPDTELLQHLLRFGETAGGDGQVAATWLLKRYQEAGAPFPESLVVPVLELLGAVGRWESRLHLLQMLPDLTIPSSSAESLKDSLIAWTQDRNLFVRAWAYSGLHGLASNYPKYRSQVMPLLERAKTEESASVRARLRQLPDFDRDQE
jgi:hypothetical protein